MAVVDQNISVGKGGIIYSEIASAICNQKDKPFLLSFVGGLGGKNISPQEFEFIIDSMIKAASTGEVTVPRLLYTETEWKEVDRLKKMAGKR